MYAPAMSQADPMPDMPGPTRPGTQHALLHRFLGEWQGTASLIMGPDQPPVECPVRETATSLGGLFAHIAGRTEMPGPEIMHSFCAIGYDLTFEQYRAVWYADVSSHIWTYTGELSPDGQTLTLTCEGPNMDPSIDSKTATYQDVHHFVSDNERTLTSFVQSPDGAWTECIRTMLRRVA